MLDHVIIVLDNILYKEIIIVEIASYAWGAKY